MAFTTDSGVSLSQTIGHVRTGMRQGLAAARRTPALVLLAVAIVAYNALMGLVAEPVRDVTYVPVNLAFLGLVAWGAIPRLGLARADLGLDQSRLRRSVKAGLLIGALVPLPLFL